MNTTKTLEKFNQHIQQWKQTLDHYDMDSLLKKQDESTWSLGQVCTHVIMAHEHFFMNNAQKCLNNEASTSAKGKNLTGKLIYLFKTFPPIKIKMPKSLAVEPPQPESVESLKAALDKAASTMEDLAKRIPDANLNIKTKHPAMGMMNVLDWYEGAEMHMRHHFRQKKRIEAFLKNS